MNRKLIGLTGPSAFTQECVDMVEEFYHADFVMLYHNNSENLAAWTEKCDGVILAGGVDIHPSVYNNSVWSNCNFSKFDLKRDIRELQVVDICRRLKKPLFGICRGHQLIGVSYGFILLPDLSSSMVCHQPQRQNISLEKHEPMHSVQLLRDTKDDYFNKFIGGKDPEERKWLGRIMGHNQNIRLWVNSFHHQGLAHKKVIPSGAEDIVIYGTARVDLNKDDKEIIELFGNDHMVSCQWHPEFDWKVNSHSRATLSRFKTLLNEKK